MAKRVDLKRTYQSRQRLKTVVIALSVAVILVVIAIACKVQWDKRSAAAVSPSEETVGVSNVDVAADAQTNDADTSKDGSNDSESGNLIFVEVPQREESSNEEPVEDPFKIIDTKPEPTWYYGDFELPVSGATGWASVQLKMYPNNSTADKAITTLAPGTSFLILEENEDWLKVQTSDELVGFVQKDTVLVNLPDLVPSIIYTDTNSEASLFRSSGVELGNVTGQQLYEVYHWNERLQREQYDMPVLFGVAYKVIAAQRAALAEGYSLRVFETFRPLDVQQQVSQSLKNLVAVNPIVKGGLKPQTWNLGWFIATKVSNHQRGIALDMSLVKVDNMMTYISGPYTYRVVSEFTELTMPTQMHELSASAIRYKTPYTTEFSQAMNENAILLHNICVEAGFSPLASEWWHFNDAGTQNAVSRPSDGNFRLQPNCSKQP